VKFTVPLAILGVLALAIVALFLVPESEPTDEKKKKGRTLPVASVGGGETPTTVPSTGSVAGTSDQVQQAATEAGRRQFDLSDWPEDLETESLLNATLVAWSDEQPLNDEQIVLGVVFNDVPVLCRLELFRSNASVINIEHADQRWVLGWDFQNQQAYATITPESGSLVALKKSLHGTPVLKDINTGNWWVPLAGVCVRGKDVGKELDVVPVSTMSVKNWRSLFPNSFMIEAESGEGELASLSTVFPRGNLKPYIIGTIIDGRAMHVAIRPEMTESLTVKQGGEVVLMVDWEQALARAYRSTVDGEKLNFVAEADIVIDRESDSTWDARLGRSSSGPRSGATLTPLPCFVLPENSWKQLHPNSVEFSHR
jgi:hypothetical protein